jgi:glutamate carboxypeptidase
MTDSDVLSDLRALVECESPSEDRAAVAACADVLAGIAQRRIDARPERIEVDGWVHLRWSFGRPRVLLLGHMDTVWPKGTLANWPFQVDGDRVTGPGVFDMKAGLVQMLEAVAALGEREGIAMLVTGDEEIGSNSSRALIEETAAGLDAVLVLEPSVGGALKTARKGVGSFRVEIAGRAAHAGLEPEKGINATVEVAAQILSIAGLARPELGTTVTPTVVAGGTTVNTVPERASVTVDVRAATVAEMDRVRAELDRLAPTVAGAGVQVSPISVRPPLEASEALFARAQKVAADLGLGPLEGVAVGGGSDGNFTAALGVPTLDGLGAVGAGAHAEGEYVLVDTMPERAALLAGLVAELLSAGGGQI